MKIVVPFIKWIIRNIFNRILGMHQDLRYGLKRRAGEAFFFWFIAVVVATIINLMIVACYAVYTKTNPSMWAVMWLPLTMFMHFVYTSFSVMFDQFKAERAELFETIKNGR